MRTPLNRNNTIFMIILFLLLFFAWTKWGKPLNPQPGAIRSLDPQSGTIRSLDPQSGTIRSLDPQSGTPHAVTTSNFSVLKQQSSFGNFRPLAVDIPHGDMFVPSVHFLWCGSRFFEFQHYLSVRSAHMMLKPNQVVIHYELLPKTSDYNQWFGYLKSEIMLLSLRKLAAPNACSDNGNAKQEFVKSILKTDNSFYISTDVVLSSPKSQMLSSQSHIKCLSTLGTSQISARFDSMKFPQNISGCEPRSSNANYVAISCYNEDDFDTSPKNGRMCVVLKQKLHPKDILELSTPFGELCRLVAYGQPEIPRPMASRQDPMPKIVHLLWLKDRNLRFLEYIGLISTVYIAGVERVFIHGISEPKGKWWTPFKNDSRYVFVHTDVPTQIFDRPVAQLYHQSDVLRIELLRKYGGIYQDFDVLWVKRIPEKYFSFDMVIGFDWAATEEWPEKFNNGLMMSKKSGRYLRHYIETLRDYRDGDWGYNSLLMTYRTYERFPHTVLPDRHLVVLCFHTRCHPTYVANYKSPIQVNKPSPVKFHWQNETIAIHFTDVPRMWDSLEDFKKGDPLLADVADFILTQARKQKDHF